MSENRQEGSLGSGRLGTVIEDPDRCYRAVQAKDPRFDGMFVTAVRTTGIYCRPSCPAITPKRANVTFHPTAAAAQQAGFRACKRCRPDAAPGSPEWDVRADAVARAVRLIDDGVVDRDGVPALARRLGYSERQLHRLLTAELGTGPLALARARRAVTARVLVETTDLPLTQVAFAAGFGSIRQFNDTMLEVFDAKPTDLRRGAARAWSASGGAAGTGPVSLSLRLPVRQPFTWEPAVAHLVATAVPGVESWDGSAYHRSLELPLGPAVLSLRPAHDHVAATVHLSDLRDLSAAVSRARFLLDLDADPVGTAAALAADPVLAPLVRERPGLRVPRTVDGAELAVRAVLGQQVSTAAARTHAGRLVRAAGEPLPEPLASLAPGVTHRFPAPAAVAAVAAAGDVLRMPTSRRATVARLAEALAVGDVDLGPGADRERAVVALGALPGIGPWTVGVVAMRALGDPDAFLPTDLGVRQAAGSLGLPSDAGLVRHAERWRPWRAYAVQHLWAALPHPVSHLPGPAAPSLTPRSRTRRIPS